MTSIDLTRQLPLPFLEQVFFKLNYNYHIPLLSVNAFLASRKRILHEIIAKEIDLTDAQKIVTLLNVRIKEQCPELYLELLQERHDIVLRLMGNRKKRDRTLTKTVSRVLRQDRMLSRINLERYDDHAITISSHTSKSFRKRGYNKLLRAVVILLTPYLKFNRYHQPSAMISDAISRISAITLYKYFDVSFITKDFNEFIADLDVNTQKEAVISRIIDYLQPDDVEISEIDDTAIDILVPISRHNMMQANIIIDTILQNLPCYFGKEKHVHTFSFDDHDIKIMMSNTPDSDSVYYLYYNGIRSDFITQGFSLFCTIHDINHKIQHFLENAKLYMMEEDKILLQKEILNQLNGPGK